MSYTDATSHIIMLQDPTTFYSGLDTTATFIPAFFWVIIRAKTWLVVENICSQQSTNINIMGWSKAKEADLIQLNLGKLSRELHLESLRFFQGYTTSCVMTGMKIGKMAQVNLQNEVWFSFFCNDLLGMKIWSCSCKKVGEKPSWKEKAHYENISVLYDKMNIFSLREWERGEMETRWTLKRKKGPKARKSFKLKFLLILDALLLLFPLLLFTIQNRWWK